MQKRLRANVTGRVQMVLFRDFTRNCARDLGLAGTVKNNDDGSLSIIAEGEEEKLLKLLTVIKKGPVLARVDHVETQWMEPKGEFRSFDIIYD